MIGAVLRWRAARRLRRDDAGFSVMELTITSALSAVVATALVSLLMAQANVERDVTTFAANQEQLREALVALQRDLRSAEPLTEVSNPLELRYRVDLRVYEDVTATSPTQIRWRLNATTDELVRETLDQNENVIGTSHRLTGVANENLNAPLFKYYKADDVPYDLAAVGTTAYTVAYCTVRVHIDLRAAPNGGDRPVQVLSDVQLRNRLPGAEECPG